MGLAMRHWVGTVWAYDHGSQTHLLISHLLFGAQWGVLAALLKFPAKPCWTVPLLDLREGRGPRSGKAGYGL